MASEVESCNVALVFVGSQKISSLLDASDEAVACNTLFASERDSLLAKHAWRFAILRQGIGEDAMPPNFEFAHSYTLPAACVRPLSIDPVGYEWVVEGRSIVTNAPPPVSLRYVSRVTDVASWSEYYRKAFEALLAWRLCFALTGKESRADACKEWFKQEMMEARTNNAYEATPYMESSNPLAEVRERTGMLINGGQKVYWGFE